MRYVYPVEIAWEEDGSAATLTFPDVVGAHTFGVDEGEALANAQDCLVAALGGYIELRRPIPAPSPARGRPTVAVPPLVAAKLALFRAMEDQAVSNVELARRLGTHESAIRRLLDLDHRSHIGQIETALAQLGMRLEVVVREAA
jgi:antitoxin HicB